MSYLSPSPRSVYILGDGLLFDEIIAHMLSSNANLRVINRVYIDEGSFLSDLNWYHPDVIFLNETDRFNGKRILALLSQITLTVKLRVIVMSLNNNNIHIYDRPANQKGRGRGVPYTLKEIANWNEMFDLIDGKQLLDVSGR